MALIRTETIDEREMRKMAHMQKIAVDHLRHFLTTGSKRSARAGMGAVRQMQGRMTRLSWRQPLW